MRNDDVEKLMHGPERLGIWTEFLQTHHVHSVAELGVARGLFSQGLLQSCPEIDRYYLIDPWMHLDDWNKPSNKDNPAFEQFYQEALERTSQWESARVVLRGRTAEVIDSIPDDSLDFAYVDGDHTLRGVTIDLLRVWPKVKADGFVAGDDFCPSPQHDRSFEPTLVFPLAVYFAEAMDVPITALGHNQFLIEKSGSGFNFVDQTGLYGDLTVGGMLGAGSSNKGLRLNERIRKQIRTK
jgi:hypothetical protein